MVEQGNLLMPDVARWPADAPVIELRGVSKRFEALTVLSDLSLTVPTGKTTVIAGASGSGKSVLLRLMNGLMQPDAGEVLLFGQDLAQIGERERMTLRKRCTMVFQRYALMDSLTVAGNVGFPLRENTRMSGAEIRRRVGEVLELLDLADAADRLPAELSGGMKKRVSFARAVVTRPEVVLFDEPTTGLDPIMVERVDAHIRATQEAFALTSVIISHDMASNRRLADQLAVLADGHIVASGTFDEVQASDLEAVRPFFSVTSMERLSAETPLHRPAAPTPAPSPAPTPEDPAPAAAITDLYKSFGDNHVLRGVSLTIPARKITVIIGGSGSGKSVLIKHLVGLMRPDAGRVEVLGHDLAKVDRRTLQSVRDRIGMLFQGSALFDSLTVGENIAFPLTEGRGASRRDARRRADALAERLRVAKLRDRYPAEISEGQRKRVALARALITEPELIIYDEPTTGQDPMMMERVDALIVSTAADFPITSVVVSHDMASTFRIADQIALLHHGQMLITGSPTDLRAANDPEVQRFIYAGAPA